MVLNQKYVCIRILLNMYLFQVFKIKTNFVNDILTEVLKLDTMKKIYYTLLFLFITTISFAQGIAIQGIARDNASSAITDTNLTFTFSITQNDNTVIYSETQAIKTDNFGVFSHIVSTGNPTTSAFNNVDFSITNLKMKVLVVYEGNTIEVYNQTFQYTPYAFFAQKAALATSADNGVPTGSIMPYLGTVAPEGWVLCKGQSITSVPNSAALIALVGNYAPNLQGMFLRGTGESAFGTDSKGPSLRNYQSDSNKSHNHAPGDYKTDTQGNHNHADGTWNQLSERAVGNESPAGANNQGADGTEPNILEVRPMKNKGDHSHNVIGYSAISGGSETRPINYGVNYIIKL
jgi:hypothetical protein